MAEPDSDGKNMVIAVLCVVFRMEVGIRAVGVNFVFCGHNLYHQRDFLIPGNLLFLGKLYRSAAAAFFVLFRVPGIGGGAVLVFTLDADFQALGQFGEAQGNPALGVFKRLPSADQGVPAAVFQLLEVHLQLFYPVFQGKIVDEELVRGNFQQVKIPCSSFVSSAGARYIVSVVFSPQAARNISRIKQQVSFKNRFTVAPPMKTKCRFPYFFSRFRNR